MTVGWIDVHGMEFPRRAEAQINSPVSASTLIDATGEKIAAMGRVWHRFSGAKLIDRVWWRFGTVVKAGGSVLVTSLQDVDLANGPPEQPDGTQDQSVSMPNAGIATGVYRTPSLSAQRSVNRGDLLAVVLEFDGAGRLGSDSFPVQTMQLTGQTARQLDAGVSLFAGGVWTAQGTQPLVLLEFSDGTFGSLGGGWLPNTALGSTPYNTGSATDERGMKIDVPVPMKIMGVSLGFLMASGANCDVVLYDGSNNVLASASVDANAIEAASAAKRCDVYFASDVLLEPGQTYRAVLKPTTTNNVTLYDQTVSDAAHWQAMPGPTTWQLTTRADGGAWTDTPATRPAIVLLVSQVLVAPGQLINSEGLVG